MKKRSITLLIATVLATAYVIYLFCCFSGTLANADGAELIGSSIATALVAPHMFLFMLGAFFGWLGFILRKTWAALTAAILYSVGTLCFLLYAMFGVPILVLGYIGYALQMKINNKNEFK